MNLQKRRQVERTSSAIVAMIFDVAYDPTTLLLIASLLS